MYADLGEMEIVTAGSSNATSHQDRHIDALEEMVDKLREENRLLKDKLNAKGSIITQEQYDEVCRKLQLEWAKDIPF